MWRNIPINYSRFAALSLALSLLIIFMGCDSGSNEEPAGIDGIWLHDDSEIYLEINLLEQTLDAYFEFSNGCFSLTSWSIDHLAGNRYQQKSLSLETVIDHEVEMIVEEDRLIHIHEYTGREGEPRADVSVYYRSDRAPGSFLPLCDE